MIKLSFTTSANVEATLPICVRNVGVGSASLSLPLLLLLSPLPLLSGEEKKPPFTSVLDAGGGSACDSSFAMVKDLVAGGGWWMEGG